MGTPKALAQGGALTVEILTAGGVIEGLWNVTANVTGDPIFVIATVEGTGLRAFLEPKGSIWAATLDTFELPNGNYTVNVTAVDGAGHTAFDTLAVTVENWAASIVVGAFDPRVSAFVPLRLRLEEIDPSRTVLWVRVKGELVPRAVLPAPPAEYFTLLNVTGSPPGRYTIQITLLDLITEKKREREVPYEVDPHASQVEVLWPDGEVNRTCTLDIYAAGPDVRSVRVTAGEWSGAAMPNASHPWHYTVRLDPARVGDGERLVSVEVLDGNGSTVASASRAIEFCAHREGPLTFWGIVGIVLSFFREAGLAIVAGFVIMVLLVVGELYLKVWFDQIEKREYEWLESDVLKLVSRVVKAAFGLVALVGLLFIVSRVSPWFDRYVWSYTAAVLPAVVLISLTLLTIAVLTKLNRRLMIYVRKRLEASESPILRPEMADIIRLCVKMVIYFVGLSVLVLIVLSAIGFKAYVYGAIGGFFSRSINYILFIVVLVGILYVLNRTVKMLAEDFKNRVAGISPAMVSIAGKGVKVVMNVLGGVIILFTLLSMVNLGEIGQTILVMASLSVTIILGMVAAGSIGNILSGLVILSMKPIEVGDRIRVGESVKGDVENVGLIFTRVRGLDGEVMEVPNNQIVSQEVVNYSRSRPFALRVDATIGYDVPHTTVIRLMKKAAAMTPHIVKDPRPQVLMVGFKDHAIHYRLKAYTDNPKAMVQTRSLLHQSMHKVFYVNGVEILSPRYLVRREETKPTEDEVRKVGKRFVDDENAPISQAKEEEIQDAFGSLFGGASEPVEQIGDAPGGTAGSGGGVDQSWEELE